MNLGGEAADQIVRYSLDGLDHSIRLSGTVAKELAVFFAAVLKDQKKTHGKTKMIRMLKENRALKFFTVPSDRLKEFAQEGKKRGLLYVVIRDRKNPKQCEIMVFADDAAKVNRVIDKLGLDFVQSENAQAMSEVSREQAAPEPVKTESVDMPEGEVRFELNDLDEEFNMDPVSVEPGNFTKAQEEKEKNPSDSSLRSSNTSEGRDFGNPENRPSVREELDKIKAEKEKSGKRKQKSKSRNRSAGKRRRRGKGR